MKLYTTLGVLVLTSTLSGATSTPDTEAHSYEAPDPFQLLFAIDDVAQPMPAATASLPTALDDQHLLSLSPFLSNGDIDKDFDGPDYSTISPVIFPVAAPAPWYKKRKHNEGHAGATEKAIAAPASTTIPITTATGSVMLRLLGEIVAEELQNTQPPTLPSTDDDSDGDENITITISKKRPQKIAQQTEYAFLCGINDCTESFPTSNKRTLHVKREHPEESPYQCPHCDVVSDTAGHLTQHIRTHPHKKSFSCLHEGCLQTFAQANNRDLHMRVHTATSKKCTTCGREFRSITGLKGHISKEHATKSFKCSEPSCRRAYFSKAELNRHPCLKKAG